MNSYSFQLDSLDRACSKFASVSAARVIIGYLTGKFWSLMFFMIAATCCWAAFSLTPFSGMTQPWQYTPFVTAVVFGLAFTSTAHILGTTSALHDRGVLKLAIQTGFCAIMGAVAVTIIVGFFVYQPVGRYIIVIATASTATITFLSRYIMWNLSSTYMPVVSLIGDQKFCEDTIKFIDAHPVPQEIHTLSLADGFEEPVFITDFDASTYPVSLKRLSQWMSEGKADKIVYQPAQWSVLEEPLVAALSSGKTVYPLSQYIEEYYHKMPTTEISNSALFSKSFANACPSYLLEKRLCDLAFSIVGMLFSLPLLMIAAVLIKIEDGGPVFYKQVRVGRYGKCFNIYKLRSMCVNSEKSGAQWASKSDSRITRIGKILRRSRVDELPQFLNIFKGDMSFIGPRPERPEFIVSLEKLRHYKLRHLLKPGLTGWAQINYPYGDSIEDAQQKLTYDLYYVKYATLSLDLQITLRTIGAAMQGAR